MEIDEQALVSPQGQKRPPEDDLENEQRLAKRFNLLNLENESKLYIPVAAESPKPIPSSPIQRKRSNAFSGDSMSVDDTKHRIYIHDLDEEIADMESDEEKIIFIPDIEKKLTKIPKSVLLGNQRSHTSNEMVLYGVPESLSVPQEQDAVRKAIIESRNRRREKENSTRADSNPSSMNGPRSQQPELNFPPTFAQSGPTGSQSQSTGTNSQDDIMEIE